MSSYPQERQRERVTGRRFLSSLPGVDHGKYVCLHRKLMYGKAAQVIFPVDFPDPTAFTHKCMCESATWVSKTAVRTPWARIVSFTSAPHWENHKISGLKPKNNDCQSVIFTGKIDRKHVLACLYGSHMLSTAQTSILTLTLSFLPLLRRPTRGVFDK